MLASAGADSTVRFWDPSTQRLIGDQIDTDSGEVSSVAFSRDGQTLASAGADRTVRLWDVATRKQIGEPLIGHTSSVTSVAFRRSLLGVCGRRSYGSAVGYRRHPAHR
jgi:WD40 repeat protein